MKSSMERDIIELEKQLQNADDRKRLRLLFQLAHRYLQYDPDIAVWRTLEALALAMKLKDDAASNDALNLLANVHGKIGQYEVAMEFAKRDVELAESRGDEKDLSSALNNLGLLYSKGGGDLDKAERCLTRALAIAEKMNQTDSKPGYLVNLGIVLTSKGEYEQALDYLLQARDLLRNGTNIEWEIAVYLNLGTLYGIHMDDPDQGLHYTRLALEAARHHRLKPDVIEALLLLARIYRKDGDGHTSLQYAQRALDHLDPEQGPRTMEKVYHMLYEAYLSQGDYKTALEFHIRKVEMDNSASREDTQVKIANLEARFDADKKRREAEVAKKEADTVRKRNEELEEKNEIIHNINLELEKQRDELARLIDQLQNTQNEMLNLERRNAVLAMAVTASHEINQPLMVLKGNLEMLSLDIEKDLTDKRAKFLQRISESVARIDGILNKFRNSGAFRFDSYSKDTRMVVWEKEENPVKTNSTDRFPGTK